MVFLAVCGVIVVYAILHLREGGIRMETDVILGIITILAAIGSVWVLWLFFRIALLFFWEKVDF